MAKTAAQRKADQRRREAEHLKAVGASNLSMTVFRGTSEDIQFLTKIGGFEQVAEMLTVLIHNARIEIERDTSQKDVLLNVTRLRETKR